MIPTDRLIAFVGGLALWTSVTLTAAESERKVEKYEPGGVLRIGRDVSGGAIQGDARGGDPATLTLDPTIVIRQQPVVAAADACRAEAAISYMPLGQRVRVDTTINITDCAMAANGEFALRVRTRDQDDELQVRQYQESWARQENLPVELTTYYDVDAGQRLVGVSIRTDEAACTCAQPAESALGSAHTTDLHEKE